ncbi:MAG: B12-binding domain/radical SAM domain protein [Candidatus Altiarchaeales archaeon IMC4]|nr:MAG: B12-binding domain/radical SAM domain protein [Candidatus Altiarchaeales archaeon IMC4]
MTVVFLHPPSIYDFRKSPSFMGPISDAVPSTQIFEMYPMGFVSMAQFLDKNGFRTRIVNLALKMLNNPKFDAEKFIEKLDAEAFCIDLHWVAHVHGALEVAKICKRFHPDTPVIFGGFTSTYYPEEILSKFPQVDFVLKGDSCEAPLLELMRKIDGQKDKVQNLSWRKAKKIKSNPISHVPDSFDELVIDPKFLLKSILRARDVEGHLPYKSWIDDPIMSVLTSKGCIYNCVNCAGSAECYRRIYNRKKPAFMKPDAIIEQMSLNEQYLCGPCFFLNDIRMGGKKYYRDVFEKIRAEKFDPPVVFELFSPLDKEFAKDLSQTFNRYNLEMSPEDFSETVRKNIGKDYTNRDVEMSIKNAKEQNCNKFDLFFMIGLGKQTRETVGQTLEYIDGILGRFNGGQKFVYPFISPYAPTLDPGCIAFENPKKYGYEVFHKTLAEQYEAFKMPSWKYFFNYKTEHLSPDDVIELTYESGIRLYEIKRKHGLASDADVEIAKKQVCISRDIMRRTEEIVGMGEKEGHAALKSLKSEIDETMKPLMCKDSELNWPRGRKSLKMYALKCLNKIM